MSFVAAFFFGPGVLLEMATQKLLNVLNVKEMARSLRVHPETLKGYVRDGKVPVLRLSARCFRFEPDAVRAALRGAAS